MAQARMPEAFFELAAQHLPPEQPVGVLGGRPPVSHRVVLNVLWYVLATGCRWEDVPPEMGCCGMTAHRYLRRWEGMGVRDRLHVDLLRLL
jgi:transposase